MESIRVLTDGPWNLSSGAHFGNWCVFSSERPLHTHLRDIADALPIHERLHRYHHGCGHFYEHPAEARKINNPPQACQVCVRLVTACDELHDESARLTKRWLPTQGTRCGSLLYPQPCRGHHTRSAIAPTHHCVPNKPAFCDQPLEPKTRKTILDVELMGLRAFSNRRQRRSSKADISRHTPPKEYSNPTPQLAHVMTTARVIEPSARELPY